MCLSGLRFRYEFRPESRHRGTTRRRRRPQAGTSVLRFLSTGGQQPLRVSERLGPLKTSFAFAGGDEFVFTERN